MSELNNKKTLPHVAILGAGPCGLYAARVLSRYGFKVTVVDKNEKPGGLATSFKYGENWYDLGVHMFHAFDQEIFKDIKEIMGDERIEVDLNATIKWSGRYFRYPLQFQDIIKGIPVFSLAHQVSALFAAQLKNYISPWQPKNAEEALIQLYGKPLYRFFFETFTHRYWGLHPQNLSATFISTKMPKLTAVDVLKKGLEKIGIKNNAKSTASALTQETLHYSRTGAETMPRRVAAAVIAAGGTIIQNASVKEISTSGNRVDKIVYQQQNSSHEIECDAVISTIPINSLIQAMSSVSPTEVTHAAQQLRYKALVVYGLLVKKPRCLDSLYVYYRDRIFHRVGEPKNAGVTITPSHYTTLIVELTCEIGDAKWNADESVKNILFKELAEEGICQAEDVVEFHISRSETGYPIYALDFERHHDVVKKHIESYSNLQSVGRQGAFTYPNMHTAMRMGYQAAEKIIEEYV